MSAIDVTKKNEDLKKVKEKLEQLKIEQLKSREKARLSKIRTQVKKQNKK